MFYARYLELCFEQDVSPSKVALDCGFNKGSVSVWKKKYLAGEDVSPSADILLKLANYFDVSVDYLLGKSESRYVEKECDICGQKYNANDERDILEHAEYHNKFITARKFFGEYWVLSGKEEEERKQFCWSIINDADNHNESDLFSAVSDLYGAWFSRSLRASGYNLNHPNVQDFTCMMIHQPHQQDLVLSRLPETVKNELLKYYREKPGIENGKSYYLIPKEENAKIVDFPSVTDEHIKFALFGGNENITDEMLDEVKTFAQFVKNKYKDKKE